MLVKVVLLVRLVILILLLELQAVLSLLLVQITSSLEDMQDAAPAPEVTTSLLDFLPED